MQESTTHIITQLLVFIFVLGIAGGFLILYIVAFNKRKKRHQEEKERMRSAFEKELIKAQLEVQEQTMQNIASEIHDNVGQLLSLIRLTLSSANIAGEPEAAQEKLSDSLGFLGIATSELRHLSALLQAETMLSNGLQAALQKELDWLSKSGKYEIAFHIQGDHNTPINAKSEIIAFRILQELLNNIIKHAMATRLEVTFEYRTEAVVITISDNGIGFNVDQKLKNPTGLGLNNLLRRANVIGGELSIGSSPGQGTCAKLKVPVNNDNNINSLP